KLEDMPIKLSAEEAAEQNGELKYAYCVRHIANEAPIRILPEELVVGAATLKKAAAHVVPVYYDDGNIVMGSLSHTTLGFDNVLKIGYKGLKQKVKARKKEPMTVDESKFLDAAEITLDAAESWHKRYVSLLNTLIKNSEDIQKEHYNQILLNLKDVPENPPKSFRQAVQALWFMFAFQRLCGNWPGIGRIDAMLGDFLKKDLSENIITLDEAREYIAHFWIRGCDWIGGNDFGGSGDGQHYQNIVLSGVDKDNNDVTNEVTYLVLDVIEELLISDFPVAVRINKNSDLKLLKKIAEIQRLGSGTVAVYNNDFIIQNLINYGYPVEEARVFANDGCWEIQIPGKTCFSYFPIDTLKILQDILGIEKEIPDSYDSFDELYSAFYKKLSEILDSYHSGLDNFGSNGPCNMLFSLFTEDCIKNARGYFNKGAKYYIASPHAGGIPDTANSLAVIKKLVYEEAKINLSELENCMKTNWIGKEELRQSILNTSDFYGNDNKGDGMAKKILHDFAALCDKVKNRNGVMRPAGVSTFGREIEWRAYRKATADGHKEGDILASNLTPSPGTDKNGPTAVIASHCKLDLSVLTNGTALDLKIYPGAVEGEQGINALIGLYKTFLDLNGIFMHIDVIDNETLKDAQAHPEKYPTLAVRVSGWSARFVTLDKKWQTMIINRTLQI
ncbi:MAG: hypothetical protein K0S55_1060, partial [Clostridia bacterium]|nr:hypothetical protein [Clostridia bacterium]